MDHLKRTSVQGGSWRIPTLCGPARSSLLKFLNVPVKEWKETGTKRVRTQLFDLDTIMPFGNILGELQKTFLADLADMESCHHIIGILNCLYPGCLCSPSDVRGTGMEPWQKSWLEDGVIKNLRGEETGARNALKMLEFVTRGCAERESAWEIVTNARLENPQLRTVIQSMLQMEISNDGSRDAFCVSTPYASWSGWPCPEIWTV